MSIPTPSETIWSIESLDYNLPLGLTPPNGQVTAITWSAELTENVASGVVPKVARTYGTVQLGAVTPGNYTPYAQITELQCDLWLKAALGTEKKENIENDLVSVLSNLVNPKEAAGIPWSITMDIPSEENG